MFGPFILAFVSVSVLVVDGMEKRSSWYCASIRHRPCYPYGQFLMCGTDNQTYYNKCELSKAYCLNNHIHLAHNSSCTGESHLASNLTHGALILLQFMCEDITGYRCEENIDPVCGSNGVSYMNECEYEQVRCMHTDLQLAHRGPCVLTRVPPSR